jgi:hypothetical protein
LKVAVDNGDVWSAGGQNAFEAGRGQSPSADALERANAAVAPADLTAQLGSRIRRVVIDKYDLPLDSRKRIFETGNERPDVLVLIQGRHDDG